MKRLNVVYGIFRVNIKFIGYLWYLKIGFMKFFELNFVLKLDL